MNPGKLLPLSYEVQRPRSTIGPGFVGRVFVSRVSSISL